MREMNAWLEPGTVTVLGIGISLGTRLLLAVSVLLPVRSWGRRNHSFLPDRRRAVRMASGRSRVNDNQLMLTG
jgi:hypothetical protein